MGFGDLPGAMNASAAPDPRAPGEEPDPRAPGDGDPPGESRDELGAHVSSAGGVDRAPGRAGEIESASLQLFTKTPSRWAEPELADEVTEAFVRERESHGVRVAGSHDSYLINLASPDEGLRARSYRCFEGELRRSTRLGLDFLVTHPGNATDGDIGSGIERNAEALTRALEAVAPGPTVVLLELTAGTGTTVGASFENLAAIRQGVPAEHRDRVAVCLDTCHAYSAGYDLVGDYDGVWSAFDDVLGLDLLRLFHLNDSKTPFDSRRDRHEDIGRGSLGEAPFRRLMNDDRFAGVPKVLETPKGDDPVAADLANLGRLRSYRE